MRLSKRIIYPLVTLIAFLLAWYLIVWLFKIPSYLLPQPHIILSALWEQRVTLFSSLLITLFYSLSGFLMAILMGLGFALLMGSSQWIRESMYPWVLVIQMTPVIILAPIIVIWFDYGPVSVIVVTFLTSFFPIVANATHGLTSTKSSLVECFRVFRAKPLQELFWLRLPYAIPQIMIGIRIAATLVTISAIFAEFFVGSFQDGRGGLGLMVFIYNKELRIPELFAAGLLACLMGLSIVFIVGKVNKWLIQSWHDSYKTTNTR